jgi:hypothetical protein
MQGIESTIGFIAFWRLLKSFKQQIKSALALLLRIHSTVCNCKLWAVDFAIATAIYPGTYSTPQLPFTTCELVHATEGES